MQAAAVGAGVTNFIAEKGTWPFEALCKFIVGMTSYKTTPTQCELLTDKKHITIEVDTGAADSIISEHMCKQHFSDAKLSKSDAVLKTYTQEIPTTLRELTVPVKYGMQSY